MAEPTDSEHASSARRPGSRRIVAWLIALPVVFFAALMLAGSLLSTPEGEQRWVDRETIKICRKEVSRPADERKTDRFASVQDCDRLEFDFKARYNENP
ncbi:MAG: hypothetical protein LBI66_02330 [Burkholderiaceae bacterium]|jgi:hypothetical protein|nr:hypothetical protein [Burkholderiaceae bacterium]